MDRVSLNLPTKVSRAMALVLTLTRQPRITRTYTTMEWQSDLY
jgi:hypothetical protein